MGYSCIFIFIQPLYIGVLCIVLSPSCKEEEVCECLLRSNDFKKKNDKILFRPDDALGAKQLSPII